MARKPARKSLPVATTTTPKATTPHRTGPVLHPDHNETLVKAVWSKERTAQFDAADDPILTSMEWVDGYEFRLQEADRARHYPNATESDYKMMLDWADDPKADRQREALDVLLAQIRKHPNPPHTPEVLLLEYNRLFELPVHSRLHKGFADRFRAWIDRVETFLSLGGGIAKPASLPAGVALTTDHESILAVLGKTPTKCKTVIDVASAGTIRNRETVGRLLRELAGFGMVNQPHGKRKGYALTDGGRKRLPVASQT